MKRSLLLIFIPFVVVYYIFFVLFGLACDYAINPEADKGDIPFNHKKHLTEYDAECESCHGYYETGRFKGIPTVGSCLDYHDKEEKYFKKYKTSDIPWESSCGLGGLHGPVGEHCFLFNKYRGMGKWSQESELDFNPLEI